MACLVSAWIFPCTICWANLLPWTFCNFPFPRKVSRIDSVSATFWRPVNSRLGSEAISKVAQPRLGSQSAGENENVVFQIHFQRVLMMLVDLRFSTCGEYSRRGTGINSLKYAHSARLPKLWNSSCARLLWKNTLTQRRRWWCWTLDDLGKRHRRALSLSGQAEHDIFFEW